MQLKALHSIPFSERVWQKVWLSTSIKKSFYFSYSHLVPCNLCLYVCCTWKISCRLYTLMYWKNTLLSNPVHKMGVVLIIKMADLNRLCLIFLAASYKIELSKETL